MKNLNNYAVVIAIFCCLYAATRLLAGCFSLPLDAVQYKPGVYEGIGIGYRGKILVRVQVSVSGIEDIEILNHGEDEIPGAAAMEELREQILEYGLSVDLDTDAVSGATSSGRGFLEAVENALKNAR